MHSNHMLSRPAVTQIAMVRVADMHSCAVYGELNPSSTPKLFHQTQYGFGAYSSTRKKSVERRWKIAPGVSGRS